MCETNYELDGVGNRKTVIKDGQTETYVTNSVNEYVYVNNQRLMYDANGNLTHWNGKTLHYNHNNQLVQVDVGDDTYAFRYDALGRKLAEKVKLFGLWFWRCGWHDGQHVIMEETLGVMPAERWYVYGNLIDEVISEWHSMNGGWWQQWYLSDALGSVYVLTDNNGNVVEAYHYSIYGSPKVYAPDGSPRDLTDYDDRILFTGREYVWQLALYYYRFRWYCPKAGRFISPEPFSNYTYSGSCPTNWLDPTGLRRVCKNIVVTLTVSDRYFGAKQVPPLVKKYRFCAEFVNCGETERVYEAFWSAAERIARAYLRFSEENLHLMDGPRPYMLTKAQMQRMRNLWGENVVGWVLAVCGKLQALMGKLTGEPPIKIVCCLGKEDPEAAARAECPGRTIWLYRGGMFMVREKKNRNFGTEV